jgi:glycerophosphoryl diester phosphodiesterase
MLRAHRAQSYYAEKALTRPSSTRPEAISHRGAHQTLPENSIPAFEQAIDLGAQAIELDVHGTRDGIVVVHHDATINAPDGRRAVIAELAADELKRYPLGGGVEVPALSAVLAAIGDRAMTYVEIKARNIEPLVVRCIRESAARCAVHSFDHRIVRNVKAIFPAIPTGVLQVARLIDPVASLLAVAARDLWQEASFIDEELVARAHQVNARVIAWTSDDPRQWESLAALGVDGICTNRIAELATQHS